MQHAVLVPDRQRTAVRATDLMLASALWQLANTAVLQLLPMATVNSTGTSITVTVPTEGDLYNWATCLGVDEVLRNLTATTFTTRLQGCFNLTITHTPTTGESL